MRNFKIAILTLIVAFASLGTGTVAGTVYADSASKTDACSGLDQLDSTQSCSSNGTSVQSVAKTVVEILSIVVGIVAVIMIIVSAFRYVTSGGDAGRVTAAKNALIYAVVGLVIVALAQTMVHFVLENAANAGAGSGTTGTTTGQGTQTCGDGSVIPIDSSC
jgi:uncharacterized membrane protein